MYKIFSIYKIFSLYIFLVQISSLAFTQEGAQNGILNIIVRDPSGVLLRDISINLYRDMDDDTRLLIDRYTTNSDGLIRLQLDYGLYIVQFHGTAPNGNPIQPAALQNNALLDDGSGVSNGFGVRFAEPERSELFVIEETTPYFDMASGVGENPKPFYPDTQSYLIEPTKTLEVALIEHQRGRINVTAAVVAGLVLWFLCVVVFIGYYRAKRQYRKDSERS